jgi:predicted nucleotidyltransferase
MSFTAEQAATLRRLAVVCQSDRLVLIGASALSLSLEMRWRATRDLDLALSVSIADIDSQLSGLTGWRRESEHRWLSPDGESVDIVPASKEALQAGKLQWPSGMEMSLTGMRLAFEAAAPYVLASGLSIDVVPVPVLVLLKMVAYLDRPHERERDLEDLAHVLDEYIDVFDTRRYSDTIREHRLDFDESGPYLLGQEMSRLVNGKERAAIDLFLTKLMTEEDEDLAQIRMARLGPSGWNREPEEVKRRLVAFRLGLFENHESENK